MKKFNDELEKLSDDELEQVAGGNISETSNDSKFLYDYGLMNSYYGTISVTFDWNTKSARVDKGWAKAGITCVTKPFKGNQYFVDGKEISRDEAYKIVKETFPKIHSVTDD